MSETKTTPPQCKKYRDDFKNRINASHDNLATYAMA